MYKLKKYSQVMVSVIVTTLIISAIYWLPKIIKPSSRDIVLGKPCDVQSLKSYNGGGKLTGTKSLQCYVYDDLPSMAIHDGKWVYPSGQERVRNGVWIYPNNINVPVFLDEQSSLFKTLPLDRLTQNWSFYNNSLGNYSFKIPNQWKVRKDEYDPNQTIITYNGELFAFINYYPNTKFEDTETYKQIKEVPNDWFIPNTSDDTFILSRNFNLNGTPAQLVETMKNYDVGASPYAMTIYITKPNSYFTITYTKYNNVIYDLPIELLIKTVKFK